MRHECDVNATELILPAYMRLFPGATDASSSLTHARTLVALQILQIFSYSIARCGSIRVLLRSPGSPRRCCQ
jgi:hypothetical protein